MSRREGGVVPADYPPPVDSRREFIRRELDASLLVIEHEMPLIMSISDRVYCLETGRVICVGAPSEVRHDPDVIASYLGTDQRAIHRSGAIRRDTPPVAHDTYAPPLGRSTMVSEE